MTDKPSTIEDLTSTYFGALVSSLDLSGVGWEHVTAKVRSSHRSGTVALLHKLVQSHGLFAVGSRVRDTTPFGFTSDGVVEAIDVSPIVGLTYRVRFPASDEPVTLPADSLELSPSVDGYYSGAPYEWRNQISGALGIPPGGLNLSLKEAVDSIKVLRRETELLHEQNTKLYDKKSEWENRVSGALWSDPKVSLVTPGDAVAAIERLQREQREWENKVGDVLGLDPAMPITADEAVAAIEELSSVRRIPVEEIEKSLALGLYPPGTVVRDTSLYGYRGPGIVQEVKPDPMYGLAYMVSFDLESRTEPVLLPSTRLTLSEPKAESKAEPKAESKAESKAGVPVTVIRNSLAQGMYPPGTLVRDRYGYKGPGTVREVLPDSVYGLAYLVDFKTTDGYDAPARLPAHTLALFEAEPKAEVVEEERVNRRTVTLPTLCPGSVVKFGGKVRQDCVLLRIDIRDIEAVWGTGDHNSTMVRSRSGATFEVMMEADMLAHALGFGMDEDEQDDES